MLKVFSSQTTTIRSGYYFKVVITHSYSDMVKKSVSTNEITEYETADQLQARKLTSLTTLLISAAKQSANNTMGLICLFTRSAN